MLDCFRLHFRLKIFKAKSDIFQMYSTSLLKKVKIETLMYETKLKFTKKAVVSKEFL